MNTNQNQAAGNPGALPGGPPDAAAANSAGQRLDHLFRHVCHTASGTELLGLMKRFRDVGAYEPRARLPATAIRTPPIEPAAAALSMPAVLQCIHRLPSLPSVVMELLASIDQDDADVAAMSLNIARDQALTAKLLRLANSSFYGRARQVTSVAEAVAVLGFRTVRSVATTVGLMHALGHGTQSAASLLPHWRHAICVAVCARELASRMQVNPDHAYTAGLLHDIGRLVLVTQFGPGFSVAITYRASTDCSMLDAERHVLGLDHADVGAALATYWKFPTEMQRAVAQHHAYDGPDPGPLGATVTLADALVHAMDIAQDPNDAVPDITASAWQRVGHQDTSMLQCLASTEKQLLVAVQMAFD